MNIAFVGGGSLRVLPIVRGMLGVNGLLEGGSVRLADRMLERARSVGRAIEACPEFRAADCRVTCTDEIDRALEGADALYVTMAIERQPGIYLAAEAGVRHGFLSSDQLSVNGAFLAARGGPAILSFARRMERLCPGAVMLIFANPVPVFSGLVNNHTKTRALGICEGFRNHQWDIPRLCGRDEYDPGIEAVSAGVNHLSFILRGTWRGRDLMEALAGTLGPGWRPADLGGSCPYWDVLRPALEKMAILFRRYGTTLFSCEHDGYDHLFPEEGLAGQAERFRPLSAGELERLAASAREKIEGDFADFAARVEKTGEIDWETPYTANRLFGVNHYDLAIPVLAALAGLGDFRIAASAPNRGAVAGFGDRSVLEYTMTVDRDGFSPVPGLRVPSPFQGLVASMSEFQSLQADAIAAGDPKIFADALEAYPFGRFTANRREFFRRMFDIYDDIPEPLKQAREIVRG